MKKIRLIRHGESACGHWKNLKSDELRNWLEAYDGAGIAARSRPDKFLIEVASESHVVCSDLPRSIGSAEILSPRFSIDPIFREAALPLLPLPLLRLDTNRWDIICRTAWAEGTHASWV